MPEEKKNGRSNGNGGTCSCMGPMGCNCGTACGCKCGGHGHNWTYFLLRVLITLIILMMVFGFGVAIGRLNDSYFNRNYMMHGYYYGYPTGVYNEGSGAAIPPTIPPTQMPMMRINGATTTLPTTGGVQNY